MNAQTTSASSRLKQLKERLDNLSSDITQIKIEIQMLEALTKKRIEDKLDLARFPQFMTIRECSRFLGMTIHEVEKLIESGQIRTHKLYDGSQNLKISKSDCINLFIEQLNYDNEKQYYGLK